MAVNIAKIKTAGSGGANGTHTGVAIRGDGSSGVASVNRINRWCDSSDYHNWYRIYFCIY